MNSRSNTVPSRSLVVHIVHRFATGGLENGVVNLVDRLDGWRHVVVALTDVDLAFAARIRRDDVECIALHKPRGHAIAVYPQLMQLLRRLRPDVVHTRNLAALECQLPAWWSGGAARIHGEHGRDVEDLDGSSRRHQWIRRAYRPFVHRYVALSRELTDYLQHRVGVPAGRIAQIYNGVDTARFYPAPGGIRAPIAGSPFSADPDLWLVGSVGRMQTVKAQALLARAFVLALQQFPALRQRLRLVLVGDGPLRAEAAAILQQAGVADLAWLPGERADVADVMRGLDSFVLPSLAEGISNTILEAMATGLPVLATRVGGNAELVSQGETGSLVPAGNALTLAAGLADLAGSRDRAAAWGRAGRARVEARFSLQAMVAAYDGMYRRLLAERGGRRRQATQRD